MLEMPERILRQKPVMAFLLCTGTLLSACAGENNTNDQSNAFTSGDSNIVVSETTKEKDENGSMIYFYGEYVLDGEMPSVDYVYDRIIFFPDGKCYVHSCTGENDRNYYTSYEYSYCTTSNYIGFSRENSSFVGFPYMTDHRNFLQFDDYVLKRVDE